MGRCVEDKRRWGGALRTEEAARRVVQYHGSARWLSLRWGTEEAARRVVQYHSSAAHGGSACRLTW